MPSGVSPKLESETRSVVRNDPAVELRDTGLRHSFAQKKLTSILAAAGIEINGSRPWDIQVLDDRLYRRVLLEGTIGAGESYMDGWWDAEALDEFFDRIHRLNPYDKLSDIQAWMLALRSRFFNLQSQWRAPKVARAHYDLGNDVYEAMLDKRMQYTCAYWNGARDLDQAQENKLHLVCRKLHLRPGMSVLELGGGFGGLAHFMATKYGCSVVMYNLSAEQVAYARSICTGLPVRVEQKDYREAEQEGQRFERVVAVGLCEHIGPKNYRSFLEIAHAKLKEDGLFLLHTIGSNESYTTTDAWINKYIFPNGVVPSIAQLAVAMEGLWVVEDLHNFGPDYDRTLLAWWRNFDAEWPRLRGRYGDRFYRMWKFYIMGAAGRFRARKLQLWQYVLSNGGIPSYTPVR